MLSRVWVRLPRERIATSSTSKPRRLFTRTYAAHARLRRSPRYVEDVRTKISKKAGHRQRPRTPPKAHLESLCRRRGRPRVAAARPEPDVSVAVARAERRLEKALWRDLPPPRGASLGDAVAYAAIALGMCLMLFSRRIPVHGPEDFALMRRAGRLAARALAHVEPHVVPGVDTGTLDDVVRAFWVARRARTWVTAGTTTQRASPRTGGVPRCAQRARRAARGDIVNVDVAVVTSEGMARRRLARAALRRAWPRGGAAQQRVRWWTRRGTRSNWGWRRVGRARGSVTCWSRSRGGCARRGTASTGTPHRSGRPIPPAADDSTHGARPAERARGGGCRPGHFFTIEPMATENGSVETATLRDEVDSHHRGPRLAERAVRAHRRGGRRACEIFTRDDARWRRRRAFAKVYLYYTRARRG